MRVSLSCRRRSMVQIDRRERETKATALRLVPRVRGDETLRSLCAGVTAAEGRPCQRGAATHDDHSAAGPHRFEQGLPQHMEGDPDVGLPAVRLINLKGSGRSSPVVPLRRRNRRRQSKANLVAGLPGAAFPSLARPDWLANRRGSTWPAPRSLPVFRWQSYGVSCAVLRWAGMRPK